MSTSSSVSAVCLAWIVGSALVSCGGSTLHERDDDEVGSGGSGAGKGGNGGSATSGSGGTGNPSGGAGGSKALDACEDNSECVLRARACCGACEPSHITDFVAINVENDAAYDATRGCDGVLCEPCPRPDPAASNRGYFVATCQANRCIAVDLRTIDVTACEKPLDCSLRLGSSCCQGCGGDEIIAISSEVALSELVCSSEPTPCPACPQIEPEGVTADCQSGRCVVARLSP